VRPWISCLGIVTLAANMCFLSAMDEDEGPSCRNAGTCLLSPDLEGRRACTTVLSRSHEMSARTEVTIDKAVGRGSGHPASLPQAGAFRPVPVSVTMPLSAFATERHREGGQSHTLSTRASSFPVRLRIPKRGRRSGSLFTRTRPGRTVQAQVNPALRTERTAVSSKSPNG
jgi:hypothetical protein